MVVNSDFEQLTGKREQHQRERSAGRRLPSIPSPSSQLNTGDGHVAQGEAESVRWSEDSPIFQLDDVTSHQFRELETSSFTKSLGKTGVGPTAVRRPWFDQHGFQTVHEAPEEVAKVSFVAPLSSSVKSSHRLMTLVFNEVLHFLPSEQPGQPVGGYGAQGSAGESKSFTIYGSGNTSQYHPLQLPSPRQSVFRERVLILSSVSRDVTTPSIIYDNGFPSLEPHVAPLVVGQNPPNTPDNHLLRRSMEINADWIQDKMFNSMRCPSCSRLMVDASSFPCHDTFCQGCADRCAELNECLECHKPVSIDSMKPNETVRNIILELNMKCPADGCHVDIQVKDFKQHLRDCDRFIMDCTKDCGETILYREQETHDCVSHLKEQMQDLRQSLTSRVEENERLAAEVRKLVLPRLRILRVVASANLALSNSPLIFSIRKADYQCDKDTGEAKSNVIKAGGMRWWVTFWGVNRFLIHAEKDKGDPSPWTLHADSITLKVLKKGGTTGPSLTHRLLEATISSDKGVVGMFSQRGGLPQLIYPRNGFLDAEGTVHMEIFFAGASISPNPPPQLPIVPEAEATLQISDLTSSLREEGDSIFSPSVHVGGAEWRVRVGRRYGYYNYGYYNFSLMCSPEEKEDWSLRADCNITVLSAVEGGRNEEGKKDGVEFSRGIPRTYWLRIRQDAIDRFLTGDILSVAVKIRVHQ
ncbi:unnamed protein product [Cyprideis torosa]|uniref:Uncharacterized protein n=1 Tax=Cyprideis torosa TaxID=163714 RepID=A0A7R8ZTU6_9CRUS|nr:unnamed protein product [Cyprideis torosa]CAG0898831.1 unnamed protein product [Cyprideis torosa]